MTEMLERVAEAIAEHGGSNWESCLKAPGQRMAGMYRAMAHAAIKAMREPTSGMMEAVDCGGEKADWMSGRAWRAGYTSMIDAALGVQRCP
jgi:hypothetical protein